MLAIVKYKEGDGFIDLREAKEPEIIAGHVIIEVKAAGICGTDLHILHGDVEIPVKPPVIVGHEFAGVVKEVGEGATSAEVGDRVTAENSRYVCGICRYCVTGSYNLCPQRLATGYAFDGAFAPLCMVPAERVHHLPDNVDFVTGALSDPSACAYHAVQELTGIDAGDYVLITGSGSMGLFSLQYVKANGGIVILTGLSRDKKRLELGKELGADYVINVEKDNLVDLCHDITKGQGIDVVLECSGAEKAAQQGIALLRKQGKYTQIGIFGSPITFDLDQLVYKEIKATGSFSQKYIPWEKAISLASQGKIKVKPLVTHLLPLEQWREGFEKFESGEAIKVVFTL
jgi:L-iditol 2-dehydrogenase